MTYISSGYGNWMNACTRYTVHKASTCHKDTVLKTITLLAAKPGSFFLYRQVCDILYSWTCTHNLKSKWCCNQPNSAKPSANGIVRTFRYYVHIQKKLECHQCFLKLLSNVKFLARQGLLLCGARDEPDSNCMQLFKLCVQDDPRVFDWLKRKYIHLCRYDALDHDPPDSLQHSSHLSTLPHFTPSWRDYWHVKQRACCCGVSTLGHWRICSNWGVSGLHVIDFMHGC